MPDELLEQGEFVRKQRALGREEGRVEGAVRASQRMLVNIVRSRFPALVELAQQKANRMYQVAGIEEIAMLLASIADEGMARKILSAPSVA
jgi:hypothetical protein